MTVNELQERLDKAIANVEKRKATIERHKKQLEKKIEAAKKLGCDPENETARDYAGTYSKLNNDRYWAMCEVSDKRRDIKDSYNKLDELEQIASNWSAKLAREIAKQDKIATEMPKIFTQLKDSLVTEWDKYDKIRRENLNEEYRKLGYKEFIHKYTYSLYVFRSISDEQIHKNNVRDAENVIIDLYNRVKNITGEVTDWSNIIPTAGNGGFVVLNGYVEGKDGKAKVESIYASGPVQRLHIRTLVNKY